MPSQNYPPMIDCLTNYITLDGVCSPETSVSGLTLNDHPEVRLGRLEDLTDKDFGSVQALFDRIYNRMLHEFESDVRTRMAKRFSRRSVVESIVTGEYEKEEELTGTAAELRGVYLELKDSPNLDLVINSARLYATGVATPDILIYDASTGRLLDTISTSLSAGYNTIQIDKAYSIAGRTQRFFICYDATAFESYGTRLQAILPCECLCGDFGDFAEVKGASIATGSTVLESELDKGNDTFGLILTANLVCGVANLICQNREDFKIAIWHRLAIEFVRELEATDQLTAYTLMRDRTEARAMLHGTEERPGMLPVYYEVLDAVINDLHIADDDICFECGEAGRKAYFLP